jgi:HK97 family phage major capsid protein
LILESEINGAETYRATLWEPYEVSLVSIPADFEKAGVGRSAPELAENEIEVQAENPQSLKISKHMKRNLLFDADASPGTGGAPAAVAAPVAAPHVRDDSVIKAERKRIFDYERNLDAISNRFVKEREVVTFIQSIRNMEPDARPNLADVQRDAMAKIGVTAPLNTPDLTHTGGRAAQYRSIGEELTERAEYKDVIKRVAGTRGGVQMGVEVPFNPRLERQLRQLMQRTDLTSSGLTSIEKLPQVIELGLQVPTVADVIPQTGTDATTIRYIQETAFANAAAAIAEDGLIADAVFSLAEVDSLVKKIAVIGRVTKETFADYAQLIAYVNARLRYMVDIKEDNHLLNGTGANNQITGLLQTAGIQTQAQGGGTAPDAVMLAATKVRTVGFYEPDAVIMNTTDWSNFLMLKDKNGQYLAGGPFTTGAYGNGIQQGMAMPRIWGLPVVPTTNIAAGTCLVGAFRLGSEIFRKLAMVIETTNSDGDDFKYDRLAIKAETRLTLAVYRPLAFCQVTGLQ